MLFLLFKVDRLIRTIKSKIWRYFDHSGKQNWHEVLDDIMENYNNSKHRSHGYVPAKIKKAQNHMIKS